MPPQIEWNMWRQIRGAFKVQRVIMTPVNNMRVEQYPTIEAALQTCSGSRVFLEPKGQKSLNEIPEGDIIIILGNTSMNNLSIAKPDETYRIDTPTTTDMYGVNAAAIAMAVRYGN